MVGRIAVMHDTAQSILLSIYFGSLILMVIGLFTFRSLAKRGTTFYESGKVWVQPFNRTDLIFCFVLIALILSMIAGKRPANYNEINPQAMTAGIWLDVIMKTFVMGLLMVCLGIVRQINLNQLFGWGLRKKLLHLLWIVPVVTTLVILCMYGVLMPWLDHFLSNFPKQNPVQLFMKTAEFPFLRASLIFSACVIAPLVEEIVFRGYLYGVLKRFGEKYFAAIISGILFSLMHANVLSLIPLFLFGLVLAAIYELTRSLWAPIAVHAAFNSFSIYQMIKVTG